MAPNVKQEMLLIFFLSHTLICAEVLKSQEILRAQPLPHHKRHLERRSLSADCRGIPLPEPDGNYHIDPDRCNSAIGGGCHRKCNDGYELPDYIGQSPDDYTIMWCEQNGTKMLWWSDEMQCIPISVCKKNPSICGEHGKCEAKSDNYTCLCDNGYAEKDGICQVIHECEKNPSICGVNGKCVAESDNYTCLCDNGYTEKDGICQGIASFAIDKCKLCGEYEICKKIGGHDKCKCRKGFRKRLGKCVDKNECKTRRRGNKRPRCGWKGKCENTIGSYKCICLPGYKVRRGRCRDINECKENSTLCTDDDEICVNYWGTYQCECSNLYSIKINGKCVVAKKTPGNCVDGKCVDRKGELRCQRLKRYRRCKKKRVHWICSKTCNRCKCTSDATTKQFGK